MKQGRRRLAAAFLCSALAGSAPAVEPGPAADVSAQAARDAFARIKGLAGRWRGASTRGWTDELTTASRGITRGWWPGRSPTAGAPVDPT